MERIATIVLLVASVAAVGYLKMEQLDLYATNAENAAAAAVESAAADAAELVEAAKIRFTIPHDRDVNTTDITVALDGSESFDAEGDSLLIHGHRLQEMTFTFDMQKMQMRP